MLLLEEKWYFNFEISFKANSFFIQVEVFEGNDHKTTTKFAQKLQLIAKSKHNSFQSPSTTQYYQSSVLDATNQVQRFY